MDSPLKIGFDIPFHEAVKAAKLRKVVLPDVYYGELQGLAKQMAFSIAGITSLDQLTIVRDSLAAKTQSGISFHQWQKEILASGTLDMPKYRLERIYRTNLQGNYNRGRWQRFEEGKAMRPYLMYDAINDSRVRPTHLARDGIIRPVDDPFWDAHGPGGINCRCRLVSLNERQAQARSGQDQGLNKAVDLEKMAPDKGWYYNPGKDPMEGLNTAIANRQGKVSDVLLSALNSKIADDMKIITLPDFHNVQNKLTVLADNKPEWFPKGFNGINAVSNPELFAGFDPKTGVIYISASDELANGFKPAQELMSTLQKIELGQQLTFNNEYAIETLWHEIIHGLTGIAPKRYPLNAAPFMEGVVQLSARHTYNRLLTELGAEQLHQDKIIKDGLSYQTVTKNLLFMIEKAGIQGVDFAGIVMSGGDWESRLKILLSDRLSISKDKINYLFNLSETKSLPAFKAKIDVQIRNAPSNKGAS